MARATHARILVREGGTLRNPWTQAQVEALATSADYIIDGYTSKYDATISTTSNEAIEIAVDVVLEMMSQADTNQEASGTVAHDGRSYPVNTDPLTPAIKERIDGLVKSASSLSTSIRILTQIDS